MAIAASGEPNICLTLTSDNTRDGTPETRYRELHNAFKILVKRVIRQFARKPADRWILRTPEGYEYQDIVSHTITSNTQKGEITRLNYMAFAEETQAGEPHLHILLRMKFIPQRWISQQMDDLISSPVIWIEKIKGVKAAIAYVSKYVTKAPAQFGKSKRYWMSRWYQINRVERTKEPLYTRMNSRITKESFREFVEGIVRKRLIPIQQSRAEWKLLTLDEASRFPAQEPYLYQEPVMLKAYLWTASWRRELRI